jgi:hypothetical protein
VHVQDGEKGLRRRGVPRARGRLFDQKGEWESWRYGEMERKRKQKRIAFCQVKQNMREDEKKERS